MSVKGRKCLTLSWNDSTVIVEKVREKALSVEKVHDTPWHLSGTVCLLIGIGTRGLSHRENRTPRRSFRLDRIPVSHPCEDM